MRHVGLAQLDRAFGYGPKGRGFESSNPRYESCIGTASFWVRLFLIVTLSGVVWGRRYFAAELLTPEGFWRGWIEEENR